MTNYGPQDRNISKFPQPYESSSTPYTRAAFQNNVRLACTQKREHLFDLKMAKVVIVGDVAVGKSSLVNRFCRNLFDREYKPTIGVDFEVEKFTILEIPFKLQIWDTAGQEKFRSISYAYYRGAEVVVAVFDLSNSESLLNAHQWMKAAIEPAHPNALRFLVGTKRDLIPDARFQSVLSSAMEIARNLNAELWIGSSKTGENVKEFFVRLATLAFEEAVLRVLEHFEAAARNGGAARQAGSANQIGSDLVKVEAPSGNAAAGSAASGSSQSRQYCC